MTEFHNFDRISQFWQNFTILTKLHNFDRTSQFWQNFTILTELHNFDRTSQFWQNFTIFSCPSTFIPTLVVFALPSTMPHTMVSVQCRTQCSDIIISTKFHNFDRISQFWQNFTTLTEFHNFNRISQFWQNFTILSRFHNFDRTSEFWQNFTTFSCPSTLNTYLLVRLIHCCELRALQTNIPDLRSWPTYLTYYLPLKDIFYNSDIK